MNLNDFASIRSYKIAITSSRTLDSPSNGKGGKAMWPASKFDANVSCCPKKMRAEWANVSSRRAVGFIVAASCKQDNNPSTVNLTLTVPPCKVCNPCKFATLVHCPKGDAAVVWENTTLWVSSATCCAVGLCDSDMCTMHNHANSHSLWATSWDYQCMSLGNV